MFFDRIMKKPSYKELNTAYRKLTQMYQDLYANKQSEIEIQDQKIEQLSKKVRQWMRKYHQLEVSVDEHTTELPETVDQSYVQKLQDTVAELSKTNHRLDQELRAQNELIIQSEVNKSDPPKSKLNKQAKKNDVVAIDIADTKQTSEKELASPQEKNDTSAQEQEVELTFSPQFQALLEKHAQQSRA